MRVAGADVSLVGGLGEGPVSSVRETQAYLALPVTGAATHPQPVLNVEVLVNLSCGN